MGYRGIGHMVMRGKRVQGVWVQGMGHMANKAHRRCGVHRVQQYGAHGQQATMGTGGI